MQSAMLGRILKHDQILGAIIARISVDVMDDRFGG